METLFTEIAKRVAAKEREKEYKKRIIELEGMCDYFSEMYKRMKEERDYADWQLRLFYNSQKHSKVNNSDDD